MGNLGSESLEPLVLCKVKKKKIISKPVILTKINEKYRKFSCGRFWSSACKFMGKIKHKEELKKGELK